MWLLSNTQSHMSVGFSLYIWFNEIGTPHLQMNAWYAVISLPHSNGISLISNQSTMSLVRLRPNRLPDLIAHDSIYKLNIYIIARNEAISNLCIL